MGTKARARKLFDVFGSREPVALVTGAGANRLGQAVAQLFAESGYRLAVHANRSLAAAEAFASECSATYLDTIAVSADITDESAVAEMVEQVFEHFQRIDVLINTAAIWEARPIQETNASHLMDHFRINVVGSFLMAQRVGEIMVGQPRGGAIVNFGDWAVQRPYPGYSAYFASKGAIETMTRSLAVELANLNRGIRVNAVAPGPVMLPEDLADDGRDRVIAGTLVRRAGDGREIAEAVLMLAENEFVTGAYLPIDGGRSIFSPGEGTWRQPTSGEES